MSKVISQNEFLTISELTTSDAPFIYELMNDPVYIENIGDRKINTISDAEDYLTNGPMASYEQYGFGLWQVALKDSNTPIGICGILQRDYLDHPDIGYATLSDYRGKGLSFQAISLTLSYFREQRFAKKLYGLTKPDNQISQALLVKAGFTHVETTVINGLETALYEKLFEGNINFQL